MSGLGKKDLYSTKTLFEGLAAWSNPSHDAPGTIKSEKNKEGKDAKVSQTPVFAGVTIQALEKTAKALYRYSSTTTRDLDGALAILGKAGAKPKKGVKREKGGKSGKDAKSEKAPKKDSSEKTVGIGVTEKGEWHIVTATSLDMEDKGEVENILMIIQAGTGVPVKKEQVNANIFRSSQWHAEMSIYRDAITAGDKLKGVAASQKCCPCCAGFLNFKGIPHHGRRPLGSGKVPPPPQSGWRHPRIEKTRIPNEVTSSPASDNELFDKRVRIPKPGDDNARQAALMVDSIGEILTRAENGHDYVDGESLETLQYIIDQLNTAIETAADIALQIEELEEEEDSEPLFKALKQQQDLAEKNDKLINNLLGLELTAPDAGDAKKEKPEKEERKAGKSKKKLEADEEDELVSATPAFKPKHFKVTRSSQSSSSSSSSEPAPISPAESSDSGTREEAASGQHFIVRKSPRFQPTSSEEDSSSVEPKDKADKVVKPPGSDDYRSSASPAGSSGSRAEATSGQHFKVRKSPRFQPTSSEEDSSSVEPKDKADKVVKPPASADYHLKSKTSDKDRGKDKNQDKEKETDSSDSFHM